MNIIVINKAHICTTTRIINIHIIDRNQTIIMSTSICLTPAIPQIERETLHIVLLPLQLYCEKDA